MNAFMEKHRKNIIGVLTGWDRVVFRGTLRLIANLTGMDKYLSMTGVLLKDFRDFAKAKTTQLIEASTNKAEQTGRPNIYLGSSRIDKEEKVLEVLQQSSVSSGLICILRAIEPCMTYEVHKSKSKKLLELQKIESKCTFLYHYWFDDYFGFMGARIQTWFPFAIQIWINGREWLAKQMDKDGLRYTRADNCFPWIEDFDRAQALMNQMHHIPWLKHFGQMATFLNPAHQVMFANFPLHYYWTSYQTEWATDVAFRNTAALQVIYPQLVRGAISAFGSNDVLRFLGKRLYAGSNEEVTSSYQLRPEGIRVKHAAYRNSVKVYNKAGSILRTESTVNNHRAFRVFRPSERNPQGPPKSLPMSKGIVDFYSRSQVSDKINNRYLEALATLDTNERIETVVAPVLKRRRSKGKSIRALRPWSDQDKQLLSAVASCGLAGDFRNRDIANDLYPSRPTKEVSGKVSYLLRLLREHKVIRRLPNTRRYRLTPKGAKIIATILLTQSVTTQQLNKAAA
jgi:hypothetical protein